MAGRSRARGFLVAVILACALLPAQAVVNPIAPPTWAELSSEQKTVLAPLAGDWNQMEFWRRGKWLDIAQRYNAMGPDEQQRMQDRMRAWAKLTADQRKAARAMFQNVQKATPEQREALKQMWAEYEALPEEDKQRLKEQAAKKSASAKPPLTGRHPSVGHPKPKLPPKSPPPATTPPAADPASVAAPPAATPPAGAR